MESLRDRERKASRLQIAGAISRHSYGLRLCNLELAYNRGVLFAISVLASGVTPTTWFGPATVAFTATSPGNPYDSAELDVWATFTGPDGTIRRPAYFDAGKWKVVLVAKKPGSYRVMLAINGAQVGTASTVKLTKAIPEGYVRKGGTWGFQFDSGKVYWPLGHNLAWQPGPGFPELPETLATMGKNGVNWSRIWACHWDGKNPWWPRDKTKLAIGQFWTPAITNWDSIVAAADKADVRFQFTLFHHGQWSSTTDSNWGENPWNVKNGGFLNSPNEFFTDSRAKRLAKNWVRYAIARWGNSRAIMAWEIFNEVQWTDELKAHPEVVGAWHDEMADYIRSLDPVGRLVTTSSDTGLPIWRKMDYWQPHGYPPRIAPMVLATKRVDQRPLFYGEVGPANLGDGGPGQALAVRDGIWSGLFALQSGAAEYWSWDQVPKYNLLLQYKLASKILKASRVLAEKGLRAIKPTLGVGSGGDLKFAPGAGWETNRQYEYHLPVDAFTSMGKFSSYFQGRGHPEMRSEPMRFHFVVPKAGTMMVTASGLSGGGAEFVARVNGAEVLRRAWPAGGKIEPAIEMPIPFPKGDVTVELDNVGSDWLQISGFAIPGIAPEATATAIGNSRLAIMRVERASSVGQSNVRLGNMGLGNGVYRGVLTDLTTGAEKSITLHISGGNASEAVVVAGQDSILWVSRK